MNNIIACIKSVFQKYATFEGRASRPEFWWFYLLNMVVGALCNTLGKVGSKSFGLSPSLSPH